MNAIQRWYFYHADVSVALDRQWCKAKDVAELERIIAEQSENYRLVTEALRGQISIQDAEITRLRDFEYMYNSVSK